MKITRLILLAVLLLLISVSLIACSTDSDENTDTTNTETPDSEQLDTSLYLPITSDSVPVITVVSSYSKELEYGNAYKALIDTFKSAGIKFNVSYTTANDPNTPEILFGDGISARGEYYIDPHSLGDEGYAIRVVGNKIIVAGGSSSSLSKAIQLFGTTVLKLDDEKTDINNLAIARSTDIFIRQYYPITSVSVSGVDLFGYDIVCDTSDVELKYCADLLHDVLYDNAGYWLNVKKSSTNPSISIKLTDYAGEDGFRVYADGKDLMIECAYPTLLKSTFETFIADVLASREVERDINFSGVAYTKHISSVSYADYGAIGDGVTDDFEAIRAAHMDANVHGQTVVAESGKTYYLGQHAVSIPIKTNTVWTGATFIIDDRSILPTDSADNYDVFVIKPDEREYTVEEIKSLSKGQTNVGTHFDTAVLLYIYNSGKKQYIRYGNNADAGASQQEIILVDKNGNVDPMTPIVWDYDTVTTAIAYPVEDKPISIIGGHFITRANAAPREYTYYKRGIAINRSNVTIDGLTHTITDEGDTGAPYNGFLAISCCSNILVKNTVLTGHKVYKLASDASNSMGTYDFSITAANNVTFKDCRQSNSITDTSYWGIMGSNYCKNLTYDGCVFSRFDAHKGTHNATIKNSEIGHQKLSVIGSGILLVENTIVHGNNIVNLRNDYGSTWDGDMIFRNVTLNNTGTATLINASWYNHDFGYTCYLPANITIDGITLKKGTSFYVLPNLTTGINTDTVSGNTNINKIVLTKKITIQNNPNNYTYYVSKNTTLFADVEVEKK